MRYFKILPAPVLLACVSVWGGQDPAQSIASDIARLRETVAAQQVQIDAQRKELEELKELVRKRPDQFETSGAAPLTIFSISSGAPADDPSARTISWMTNYPATSRVDYGSSPDQLDKTVSDDRHVVAHTVMLKGVGPSTPIYLRVASVDAQARAVAHVLTSTSADYASLPARTIAPAFQSSVNPSQEVAPEAPSGPALQIGPAQLRIGGYLAATGIYRSTNSGGGPGTSFASFPYSDRAQGNVSEFRLSAQSTRISLRVDAPFPERRPRFAKLSGYFEMDFQGQSPGSVAVTSSGVGFRMRQAFAEVQYGKKFFVAAGQAFTLMTPAKDQLSIWPSDYEMSQAVDTNYLAGMVWDRTPQARFTWRPSRTFNWAFSAENPEQHVGSWVKFPVCCASDLSAQYNTGDDELTIPNRMPDLVTKVAFNANRRFHVDVGGVFRYFRHTIKPYDRDYRQAAGGGSAAAGFYVTRGTKILAQGSYGSGMGRYIGGLIPDVIVRADGTISPVRSASWVGGVEQVVSKDFSIAAYYSGAYAYRNHGVDSDGMYLGFGYPGSSNSNNRRIQQFTGVFTWRTFKTENRGSMQWSTQFSNFRRDPWSVGSGPIYADMFMMLTQIRYNLP